MPSLDHATVFPKPIITKRMKQEINLNDPDPKTIRIEDIAYELAHHRRLSAHIIGHYAMAQHSIWVSEYLMRATDDPLIALYGLLRKASVAYTGDVKLRISRLHDEPFLTTPEQQRMQTAVYQACHLPEPTQTQIAWVQKAALQAFAVEARLLTTASGYNWDVPEMDAITMEMFQITKLDPVVSEQNFLEVFKMLLTAVQQAGDTTSESVA